MSKEVLSIITVLPGGDINYDIVKRTLVLSELYPTVPSCLRGVDRRGQACSRLAWTPSFNMCCPHDVIFFSPRKHLSRSTLIQAVGYEMGLY